MAPLLFIYFLTIIYIFDSILISFSGSYSSHKLKKDLCTFLFVRVKVELLSTHAAIDVANKHLESCVFIGRVQCRCLHGKTNLQPPKASASLIAHRSYALEVTFIPNEHICYCCDGVSCMKIHPLLSNYLKQKTISSSLARRTFSKVEQKTITNIN